ncbi:hypothetical protein VNI00_016873 [Paramarasmius palmivorus]|uniref:CxC6 like cysteine cluster associated with KDZ domain-containing protein n=1 Tax=Paramarasmius palmivorus TaxID=297713 RepID=A0AAW0BBC4_9AGAR
MPLFSRLSYLQKHDELRQLDFRQISLFIHLGSLMKDDINLTQPLEMPYDGPPPILPPSIQGFLSDATGIALNLIPLCWGVLKEEAWEQAEDIWAGDEELFRNYGWNRGIMLMKLYPHTHFCDNADCDPTRPMKRENQRQIIIYTLSRGAQPGYHVHLTCESMCYLAKTAYHNNYRVVDGTRIYYSTTPKYLQVGEHQFVEDAVAATWTSTMVLGWFSATNGAHLYNQTLAMRDEVLPPDWKIGKTIETAHVWDAFIINALLQDSIKRGKELEVPHTGDQCDRFKAAMERRNCRIVEEGQEEIAHACDKCMRVTENDDGTFGKVQVLVCDGLSIGHPCCSVFRCTEALKKNSHRFCQSHAHLELVCSIVGCDEPVVEGRKTCADAVHQKVEDKYYERGGVSFILRERYRRTNASVVAPTNSVSTSVDNVMVTDLQEEFSVGEDGDVRMMDPATSSSVGQAVDDLDECGAKKSEQGNRVLKAIFSQQRTHNEQIAVRPCGVIVGRATFHGAEAVSNIDLFLKALCNIPGFQKPEGFIYDCACDLHQQRQGDPWYDNVALCVDVFHFLNKHKVTHKHCQENCNPAMYPELMTDDKTGWFFNTSIAEQTNLWLGGYQAICRELGAIKFNFFLDEMIRLRNAEIVRQLATQGYNPWRTPANAL